MIQEGVVTIQPLEQKTVFHTRLELENHRKMNIKTHTHIHQNTHALFWQATHTYSSQKLVEYYYRLL